MTEIPNFQGNLKFTRDLIYKMGSTVTLPEATLLAMPVVLRTATILHPKFKHEIARRAGLVDQSPIDFHKTAEKFLNEIKK